VYLKERERERRDLMKATALCRTTYPNSKQQLQNPRQISIKFNLAFSAARCASRTADDRHSIIRVKFGQIARIPAQTLFAFFTKKCRYKTKGSLVVKIDPK
jgi:hypothetical protein